MQARHDALIRNLRVSLRSGQDAFGYENVGGVA